MFHLFSLMRELALIVFLVSFAEQSLGTCWPMGEKDHAQDAKKYSADMSTIMLHHELRWPPADTNSTVLYTVEFKLYTERDYDWCAVDHCQDIRDRMCDIDDSKDEATTYFEHPLDFLLRITGHLEGSNETIYATEPILFNKHKNLTIYPPSIYLTNNESGLVILHLKMNETNWKGLNDDDLDSLQFEIQYWNGDESDPEIHMETASKRDSEFFIQAIDTWICGRARLHTDGIGPEMPHIYSAWSEVNCTAKVSTSETQFNIIIPFIAIVSLFVIILIVLSVRGIWRNVCKEFFEKAPLPDAIVKIIFHDDMAYKDRAKSRNCISEEFEAVDYENNNRSRTTLYSPSFTLSPVVESFKCKASSATVLYENDFLPACHSSDNVTYGIKCPRDSPGQCFQTANQRNINAVRRSSSDDKLLRYRNYLSSTSTASTEISTTIVEDGPTWCRFEDNHGAITSENAESINDSTPTSNLYFRNSSTSGHINDFDGFNIAYSSNPMRDVPDLLYEDKIPPVTE